METVRFTNVDGLTYNSIINTMKEMMHREKYKNFPSFNNNEYYWDIGFDVLRRFKYTNPDLRPSSEIDEILGIKVRRILYHTDDASKICLTNDVNDCIPIMIASRGSGKTYTQFKYLDEMMKKWNRGIVNNNQSIKNVIFNDPATIVFWTDGTKTVVKAENEPFDPEKGLAMAIAKKSLGNKGDYYNEFKKWLPKEEAKWKDPAEKVCSSCKYFTLDSSALAICQECLKDETLPNWEKVDKEEIKELISLTRSKEDGNCDNAEKNCDDCKYNEQTDTQLRCFTCEYVGLGPLEQPCCDCVKNMGFSYYREKKDD